MKYLLISLILIFVTQLTFSQNVGIGEAFPNEAKLQVKRADSALLLLHNSTTTGTENKAGLFFKTGTFYSGSLATIGSGATFRMGLFTYGGSSPSSLIERISILDGGNVGIGTTSPTAKLEVAGSLKIADGTQGAGKYLTSSSNGLASWVDLTPNLLPAGIAGQTIRNNGSSWLSTSNLYNDGSKVGIGTTTPGSMLEIKSTAFNTADLELNASLGDNAVLRLNKNGSSNYSTLRFKTSGANNWDLGMQGSDHFKLQYVPTNSTIMDVDNTTRNIGFFTNDFSEAINIAGSLGVTGASITKGSNAGFQFYDRTTNAYGGWNWYADAGKANLFRYGGLGNALTIDQSGKLGIGISAPTSPLSFPTSLGKKISLYPGATGDAGLGVYANELRINADYSGADITFGYDNFASGFTERMRVKGNGNVGIGTTNPTATLHVARGTGSDGTAMFYGTNYSSHFNYSTTEDTYIRGGKTASKVIINDQASGDVLMTQGGGNVGIGAGTPSYKLDVNGRMRLRHNGVTSGVWFNNSLNTESSFIGQYTDNLFGIFGNAWQFAVNRNDGTVFLGSGNLDAENLTTGAGYKLRVYGKIISEEVRVQLKNAWPDYVFADNYKRLTIPELEKFVLEHRHLPNIPSAKEIESNGQMLGEMQQKMLEKIEELTLYIIEADKKIDALTLRLNKVEKHVPNQQ